MFVAQCKLVAQQQVQLCDVMTLCITITQDPLSPNSLITAYDAIYFRPQALEEFKDILLIPPTKSVRNQKANNTADRTFLLHGMFGLGKTAFSKNIVHEVLKQKSNAIRYKNGAYFIHCGEGSIGNDNVEPIKRLLDQFSPQVTIVSFYMSSLLSLSFSFIQSCGTIYILYCIAVHCL
jgi:predicted ATPase